MKPWVKTGLFFAILMFVFMTFISPYIYVWIGLKDETEQKFTIGKIITSIVVWTIFGFYMGYNSKNKKSLKNKLMLNMKPWVKFGLFWGVFMGLMLTVVFPLFDGTEIYLNKVLISIPVWLVFGLIFGYISRKKEPKTGK